MIRVFRSRFFTFGSAVLVVVLLAMLGLQIQSLLQLKRSIGTAGRLAVTSYLIALGEEVRAFYEGLGQRALIALPIDLFSQQEYGEIVSHFRQAGGEGVKLFFVQDFSKTGDSQILLYNPKQNFTRQAPTLRETHAVQTATAAWIHVPEQTMPREDVNLYYDWQDPENRVLFRPIRNSELRIIGTVGFVADTAFFAEILLPKLIKDTLPRFFPEDGGDNLIISVYDQNAQRVFANHSANGQGDESKHPRLFYLFRDWYITVQSRHVTPEQWARRNFLLSLATMCAMAAIIIVGIITLLQNASRSVKLSEMKAEFLSNVSHELQTPLASIRVVAEFMRLGRLKDSEAIQRHGQQIESETQRLTQLIKHILDCARSESGKRVYQFERADLEQVVCETIDILRPEAEQGGFAVDYRVLPKPLPPVMIDKAAIGEALINLLDNAIKYSGTSKHIAVRLGQENGFLAVSVIDHGIGLGSEDQERIFDKFYRVGDGLVHNVRGSGLGLSISRHIVEAHHGKISVESKLGAGSIFTMYLPVMKG